MDSLYAEHLALGATFDDDGLVSHYAGEPQPPTQANANEARLADIGHIRTLLLSGDDAPAFASTAFAGARQAVGECSFQATLTGDGGVASIPLVARTGQAEYVAMDLSARAEVLEAWLSFLSSISQNGHAPFARLSMQDATGTHAVLALWGPAARAVLADYAPNGALPQTGRIASAHLDQIPCILAHPPLNALEAYLVLVAPAHASVLWRSILSFGEVTPVGMRGLAHALRTSISWYDALGTTDTIKMPKQALVSAGLVRADDTYVGARGLDADTKRPAIESQEENGDGPECDDNVGRI